MNIMGHGRFCTLIDRCQELLDNDPESFETTLDLMEDIL